MTNTHTALRPTRFRAIAVAVAAAAALTLTACSGSPASASVSDTTWGSPDSAGKPFITFTADGKAGGNDGCNIVGGSWTEKDGSVSLDGLFSTMMFCEGVDTWLSTATSAVVEGDTITFSDEKGAEVGSLEKTKFTPLED